MSDYFLSSLSSALLILAGLQSSPVAKLPEQPAYDAPSLTCALSGPHI